MKTTIITHNGVFHADEVLAIALLKKFTDFKFNIIRTRDAETINSGLLCEETFVLDVGKQLDYSEKNMDHHQYEGGKATCMLVLDWLVLNHYISQDESDYLADNFIRRVSDIDTGTIPGGGEPGYFNNIIKQFYFNGDEENSFTTVLGITETILGTYWQQCLNFSIIQQQLDKVIEMFDPNIFSYIDLYDEGISYHSYTIPYLIKKGYLAMVSKTFSGVSLRSFDSKRFPIAKDDKQTFLHEARFVASYANHYDAINAAGELDMQIMHTLMHTL